MRHLVTFSGGKDSLRLLIWAEENLGVPGVDWTPVTWDTGWEHPITYAHIDYINEALLRGSLVRRASKAYPGGFVQLVTERNRFPGVKARFCTEELKIKVQHEYLAELDDEATLYQGIRADESAKRAKMAESQWVDDAGGYWIRRPILRETADQVFASIARRGIRPNPLYLMGQSRVGCWPCVMTGLRELKQMLGVEPELRQRLIDLEAHVNTNLSNKETRKWPATFWAAGTIPDRFCSLTAPVDCRKCEGSGRVSQVSNAPNLFTIEPVERISVCPKCEGAGSYTASVPTAEDVFRYIERVEYAELPFEQPRACMSVYNLCE